MILSTEKFTKGKNFIGSTKDEHTSQKSTSLKNFKKLETNKKSNRENTNLSINNLLDFFRKQQHSLFYVNFSSLISLPTKTLKTKNKRADSYYN